MKRIWGLFATYQDAVAALAEFRRQGFAAEDLSAVARPGMAQGGAPAGKARGPKPAGGGRDRGQGWPGSGNPAPSASRQGAGLPGGQSGGPPMRLPNVRPVRLAGWPPLLASGHLATALEGTHTQPPAVTPAEAPPRKQPQAGAAGREQLAGVLAGLGLPETYAANYAAGVRRGQVLLAVRAPDERERDTVMIMRRYRVMQLAGQPAEDEE